MTRQLSISYLIKVVNLHPILESAAQLEKIGDIIDDEKMRDIADEFDIDQALIIELNGNWREMLFFAVTLESNAVFRLRLLEDPIMKYGDWVKVSENKSPLTEVCWMLSTNNELNAKYILNLNSKNNK